MCKNKYFDCVAIILGIILSIAIAVLTYLELIPGIIFAPWIALGFSALVLLLLTIISTSLLRQDSKVDKCVCRRGVGVLVSSILTFIFSVVALLGTLENLIAGAVFIGLIFVFFIYQIFAIYSLLYCVITAGCKCEERCECDCK